MQGGERVHPSIPKSISQCTRMVGSTTFLMKTLGELKREEHCGQVIVPVVFLTSIVFCENKSIYGRVTQWKKTCGVFLHSLVNNTLVLINTLVLLSK